MKQQNTDVADIVAKDNQISFSQVMMPLCIMVFCTYVCMGISLGALPAFLHNQLHCNNLIIGVVIGTQSFATLMTRHFAGKTVDTKNVRIGVAYGSMSILATALLSLLAICLTENVILSLAFIFISRILLGTAESLQITSALAWGIDRAGKQRSGKVMAWNGIAIYGGLSVGAPLGIFLLHNFGMAAAFTSFIVLAIIGWLAISKMQLPTKHTMVEGRTPFYKVVSMIAKYGLGLAFSAVAFGCIASFIELFFQQKGWANASLAFLLFGGSYIGVRIFFAHLTDKVKGNTIAFFSLLIELAGQILLWQSTSPAIALVGVALTGGGFSLIFPAFGVEAVKHVRPQMRGIALGAYVVFFDLALGITGPVAGVIAGSFGYQSIFLFGGTSALIAIIIAAIGLFVSAKK